MSIKDFQILNKLGEGSFSSVWKVKRISDGQEYAMKKVKLTALSEKEKQNALNEVRILASIKSPFIIGYKEAFFEDNSMTLCVVMEYAGGGDIFNKIVQHQKSKTHFKEQDIWSFAIQMFIGLKVLHDMKILHRDLKCANIFLSTDGKTIKLGDLNVSKVAKDNLAHTQTGTPYYASPEVWSDKPYDAKSDIWSIGCVIYEMCALKPPFTANDMQGLFKKIQRGVFDKIPNQYSIDLYNLISMCLQVKPTLRPSCDQLLTHPIVQKNGTEMLQFLEDLDESQELLGTIKLPKNMRFLAQQLPKANYEEDFPVQVERGRLGSADPHKVVERETVKRPTSQNPQLVKNRILVRDPQSRGNYASPVQKSEPLERKENEKEYLARMQKEYLERAKPINTLGLIKEEPTPKQVAKGVPPKSPNYRPISGKNAVENVNSHRQEINKNGPSVYNNNQKVAEARKPDYKNDYYSVPQNQQQQQRLNSRERNYGEVGPERVMVDRQEYLINKYQIQNKVEEKNALPRIYQEKSDDALLRKADYLIQKYQGLDINKRDVVSSKGDVRRQVATPSVGGRKDAQDILDRYKNIYSKEGNGRAPSAGNPQNLIGGKRVDQLYLNYNNNLYGAKKNYVNNSKNEEANLLRQQTQIRGAVKPQWWG